jgi:hypothetical protein
MARPVGEYKPSLKCLIKCQQIIIDELIREIKEMKIKIINLEKYHYIYNAKIERMEQYIQ